MKAFIKRSFGTKPWMNSLIKIYHRVKYSVFVDRDEEFVRFYRKRQSKAISNYIQSHQVRKLHIGSQLSLPDWLDVDLHPKVEGVEMLDATKLFPIPSDSFHYVFTEHMIEHITFEEAEFMLAECYRIMRRNGKIRIATPDLLFLIELYNPSSEVQKKYIEMSISRYTPNRPVMNTTVINNFFRDWEHQFIHDFKSLEYLLTKVGFSQVKKCEVGKSEDANLMNLEKHGMQIGEAFNKLETIVVEATKL
jgi:predicted SAM-dependent methyltransferase